MRYSPLFLIFATPAFAHTGPHQHGVPDPGHLLLNVDHLLPLVAVGLVATLAFRWVRGRK